MKPERHIWDEDSTHRAVAGKEYDEVWDYAEQLEAELDNYRNRKPSYGKVVQDLTILELENEALSELLSPLVDVGLERDKLKAENEALQGDVNTLTEYLGELESYVNISAHREGWANLPAHLRHAIFPMDAPPPSETPISDVPITP